MKKMTFLLFLSLIFGNPSSALADAPPEGEDGEVEEEVART